MKYFLGFLVAVLIVFGGVYLAACFVTWSVTDISEWSPADRFFYLMLGAMLSIPMVALVWLIMGANE